MHAPFPLQFEFMCNVTNTEGGAEVFWKVLHPRCDECSRHSALRKTSHAFLRNRASRCALFQVAMDDLNANAICLFSEWKVATYRAELEQLLRAPEKVQVV